MSKALESLERIGNIDIANSEPEYYLVKTLYKKDYDIIKKELKRNVELEEENKLLRENNENLDENYFDTWSACERLKENSDYALMFIDNIYCLVDTKDNKFEVIDNFEINSKGIIDNKVQKKLKALEIIKKKRVEIRVIFHTTNVMEYNEKTRQYYDCLPLTQEEYDLLKEVLL